ncbi:MAG: hypothetical protein JNK47_12745 [Mesorhizobium sp.]|nr:hypothetical protein [Mesorhizobium sp.]MBL8578088.1 hypothetical protein [Mesorhizobium sp.]
MARGLPRTLQRAAMRQLGKPVPKAGLACKVSGQGGAYRLDFTFTNMKVTVTDALAYASQKLFDFVEGKIRIKGGTGTFTFGVDTARASTINDSASLTWGIGSAAASSATLATTMQNIINTVTRTLTGAVAAPSPASPADVVGTAITLDGTSTAVDLFMNFAFATGTDIDGDGILSVNGKLTLFVENWGDNA